jgi:hypothetical protein
MKYKVKEDGDCSTIILDGDIDETIHNTLFELRSALKTPKLIFDCKNVHLINSMGIAKWSSSLKDFEGSFDYRFRNVPRIFLDVVMMVPSFIEDKPIETFFITGECEKCSAEHPFPVQTSDFLESGDIPDAKCPKCGSALEPDADADEYLDYFRAQTE